MLHTVAAVVMMILHTLVGWSWARLRCVWKQLNLS